MNDSATEQLTRIDDAEQTDRLLDARYALYDDVGSGPLGHVYGAWDYQISHRVAVKVLHRRFLDQPEVTQAFECEARRAASLPPHRSIASIHDVDRDGHLPYIVMEYVPGHSLRSILNGETALSVEQAFEICRQVADGLDFAHEYGIVHGNIKPENIFVSRNGQARSTDFGIAQAMDLAEALGALPPLTRARYLSPEEAFGRRPGPASDIYSLGVVLYEMLIGRLPFQGGDLIVIPGGSRHGGPRDAELLHPIAEEAWRIVLRALARNPEGRYRTAGAFALALHQYLLLAAGSTMLSLPASMIEDRAEHAGTQQAAELIPSLMLSKPRPAQRDVARPARPRRLTVMSLVFALVLALALTGGWLAYRAVSDVVKHWGQPAGAQSSRALVVAQRPFAVSAAWSPHFLTLETRAGTRRAARTVRLRLG